MQENLLHFLQGHGRICTINQLVDISAQIAAGMRYLEVLFFVFLNKFLHFPYLIFRFTHFSKYFAPFLK